MHIITYLTKLDLPYAKLPILNNLHKTNTKSLYRSIIYYQADLTIY